MSMAKRSHRSATTITTLVVAGLAGLTGCAVNASSVDPELKTFPYEGEALRLETNEVATEVIATDRSDIQVTRWFDHVVGSETLKWELEGDTLEIDAGCRGIAVCDARFEVEVPADLAVTKDGEKLDLEGS